MRVCEAGWGFCWLVDVNPFQTTWTSCPSWLRTVQSPKLNCLLAGPLQNVTEITICLVHCMFGDKIADESRSKWQLKFVFCIIDAVFLGRLRDLRRNLTIFLQAKEMVFQGNNSKYTHYLQNIWDSPQRIVICYKKLECIPKCLDLLCNHETL